jgi:phosphoadenosine phosphosulfate reductase
LTDFAPLLADIEERFADYRARGLKVFATSSFQTNSVVLLHLVSRYAPEVPVYFLNTGFHFPETLAFRDQLARDLGLTIRAVRSPVPRAQQRSADGRLLFTSDPDYCCHLNKVLPLEPVLLSHDVWVNGVRASQSSVRKAMKVEQPAAHGTLRYHPLLGWDSQMVHQYLTDNDLPRHPLEDEGYFSVGCRPCTRKLDAEALYDERTGRWFGLKKTECGLHTDLGAGGDA